MLYTLIYVNNNKIIHEYRQCKHDCGDLLLCLSVIAVNSCCNALSSEALSAGVGSDLKHKLIHLISKHVTGNVMLNIWLNHYRPSLIGPNICQKLGHITDVAV